MKLKKIARRLAGALAAGTLMVSMMGMTVFAEGVYSPDEGKTAVTSVPIKKTVTTDGNTYAPNTTFSFEVGVAENGVKEGEKESDKDFNGEKLPVYKGITGGLSVEGNASYTGATVEASYDFTGASLTVGSFTNPGIYHYVVKETAGSYEGISYSSEVYDVYVYAFRNDDNSIYVGYVETVKKGETGVKGDLSFTNDYGKENDTIHKAVITKQVQGSLGDVTKGFEFTVKVDGAEGEKYKVVVKESAEAEEVEYTAVSGSVLDTDPSQDSIQPVILKHGGTITIYGLSESDVYTVTENDYSSDGYTTKVDDTEGRTASGSAVGSDVSRTVYNIKNAVTPTGVILNIAPYILMVALAGVLAFFFLRRRKSEF